METMISVYFVCVLVMFAALYFYTRSEKTIYHATMARLSSLEGRLKILEDLVHGNLSTVSSSNLKIKAFDEKMTSMSDEINNFQEHLTKVREQQIKLREILSRKKKTVTLDLSPTLIAAFSGKAKDLSKQIKELKL